MHEEVVSRKTHGDSLNGESQAMPWAEILNDLPNDSYDLGKMLNKVGRHALTREERREQRISWTMGMMSDKNKMTRKEIEELHDSIYG